MRSLSGNPQRGSSSVCMADHSSRRPAVSAGRVKTMSWGTSASTATPRPASLARVGVEVGDAQGDRVHAAAPPLDEAAHR